MFEGKQSNLLQFSPNRTYCVTSDTASKSNSFTSLLFHFAPSSFSLPWNGSQRNQNSYKSMSLQETLSSAVYWVSSSETTQYVERLWKPTHFLWCISKGWIPLKICLPWQGCSENLTLSVRNHNKYFTKQQSLAKLVQTFVLSGKPASNINPLAYTFHLNIFEQECALIFSKI